MSTESKKPAEGLVQELLAARRGLMVANERLKLELEEARAAQPPPSAPSRDLELEIERLQSLLEATRAEVEAMAREREIMLEGIERALERLEQKRG